jgi:hypothetical protein
VGVGLGALEQTIALPPRRTESSVTETIMNLRLSFSLAASILAVAMPSAFPAPPDSNVCSLLTRDEATAAVGSPVGEGKPVLAGGSMGPGIDVSACAYAAGSKELQVNLWRFSPAASKSLEFYRGFTKQKEQVAGLGDLACWYNSEHKELQIVKGSSLLTLELKCGRRDSGDALVAAAKQAVGRLR